MDSQDLLRELTAEGIRDDAVLAAIASVPRHEFVPEEVRHQAWENHPLPIGSGQTISQPYIVAFMTEALGLHPGDTVLDVGTGCGYQAAVLSACGAHVHSVEVRPELAERARSTLSRLGYGQIRVVCGDGRRGLSEAAPFDGIVVAAATRTVPAALIEQLRTPARGRPGGRLILPVGGSATWWGGDQRLVLIERTADSHTRKDLIPVRFVPLL